MSPAFDTVAWLYVENTVEATDEDAAQQAALTEAPRIVAEEPTRWAFAHVEAKPAGALEASQGSNHEREV